MTQALALFNDERPTASWTTKPASLADTEVVALSVVAIEPDVEEVRLNSWPIGYIHRADRIYVTWFGARRDRAVESGQFLDRTSALLHLLDAAQPVTEVCA